MNYNKLVKLNKRQFDKQCNIEGQNIYNFSKDTNEKVIFSRTTDSKTTQDKTTIYFSSDGSIEKGDILIYRDKYYIVQNVNCPENEAWHISLLIKCNTVWSLFGETVPMVSSELSSASPKYGTVPRVNGVVSFYTKDIPMLHKKISINDVFMDFGGCYKLVNKFFIDGIAFLYFERDTYADLSYVIKCANNNLNIKTCTKAKFYMYCNNNGVNYYLPTAEFSYSSSDEGVATIDADGNIEPISDGNFNINVRCTYTFDYGDAITSKNTKTYEYTQPFAVNGTPEETPGGDGGGDNPGGSDEPDNPDVPVLPSGDKYLELTSTTNKKTVQLGYLRKINCAFYVDDVLTTLSEMPTLSFPVVNSSGIIVGDAKNYIAEDSRTTNSLFYITLEDNNTTESWLISGYYLRVTATLSDGTTGYIDLEITW